MSKDKDYGIAPIGFNNGDPIQAPSMGAYVANNLKKLNYLIVLSGEQECFVTIGKPDFVADFVTAKGFFTKSPPGEIIKKIDALLTSVDKDLIYEMYFPVHRVKEIQNLMYRAK